MTEDRIMGQRAGIRWAIATLHKYAGTMNDPKAKAVLNAAAHVLALDAKDLRTEDADDIAAGLEALNTPIVAAWPEVRERLGLGLEPKREEDWSMDDDALKSAFIVWVDYGTEGWSPFGYNTLEDATRAVASGFSHPVVITGPVLFPPAKED